ncbi:E3 ubiquitin-protein ligase DCST1 [Trematomus bernacchii]|uniref:E3 ubiquitin-protein ligase DCST1 n=1 Tax=Trematomus bernacchii TaxID=40690 RepID=UPI00146D7D80|nr:E3 ubiquitin-protein ligase DCST1 [Trematomus bernacchii]
MADTDRHRDPHSTVERLSLNFLPPAVHRLLFSQSEEFPWGRLLLRAMYGAVSGTVLFLGLCHSLPLTFDLQLAAAAVFIGVCAACCSCSSSCRCSLLLMFPSMLGTRGRAYLMLLLLTVLCRGPLSNIQSNVEAAALSLSCNLDLQIHHSKVLWRETLAPYIIISQQLMDDKEEFQSEVRSVSRTFQDVRDQVVRQYGYNGFNRKYTGTGSSTQEQFSSRTMMQCDNVVEGGVQRCSDWFSLRWAECMEVVSVPVINHLLCVFMRLHFLCDVFRVMTPWCRDQIPVEGNFGQLFDRLNQSVDLLSREFSAELVLQVTSSNSTLTPPNTSSNSTLTPPSTSSNSTLTPPSTSSNSTLTPPNTSSNSTLTPPSTSSNSTLTPLSTSSNSILTPISPSSNSTLTPPNTSSNSTLTPLSTSSNSTLTPLSPSSNSILTPLSTSSNSTLTPPLTPP